ncbi:MAG: hypothetical protein JXL84_16000 [Deltaproteobacteria bacterium]|nr:hypothetical protein [Deltaproteobacteria bacterium]
MKKVLFLVNAFFLLGLILLSSPAGAQFLRLDIKEFWCMDGRYHIEFSVVNKYTHDMQVTVAFKLFDEKNLFACKRVLLDVPAGADGSDPHNVSVEAPCRGLNAVLEGKLFDHDDRSRVGIWLMHCP